MFEEQKTSLPRITFGIIVLNGEPFTRYCLRSLYPFAHEIIVVEGASPAAVGIATPDGHSSDGTFETLYDFQAHEDPDDKLVIVTAEDEGHPNGFWPGEKDEQSQAYAKRATGDYLWQVDIDEFYHPQDMQAILDMLSDDPHITAVSFKQIAFWGGFDYIVDSWYFRKRPEIWRKAEMYHRLFKWGAGYKYVTHRPPTVYDSQGQDLRHLNWVNGYKLARAGILLYHYSLVFPKQVVEKCEYYGNAKWAQRSGAQQWAQKVFMELQNPYRVHNVYDHPSWLESFTGDHPPEIESLRSDLNSGKLMVSVRPTEDIERLLRSPKYRLGRAILKSMEPWDRRFRGPLRRSRVRFWRLVKDPFGSLNALRRKIW